MDYEQMSVQELRAECQARGLGTARSKAELVQRLTDDDGNDDQPSGGVVETEDAAADDTLPAPISGPDYVLPARSLAGVFRMEFPAEPGGPDEETHLAYRQAAVQAASDAGLTSRDGGRLAETSDDTWVYEVLVKREA